MPDSEINTSTRPFQRPHLELPFARQEGGAIVGDAQVAFRDLHLKNPKVVSPESRWSLLLRLVGFASSGISFTFSVP